MPLKIVVNGYIQVYRDGSFISQHRTVEDAIESCVAHAAAHSEGDYDIIYPTRKVSITVPLTIIKNALGGVGVPLQRAPVWSIDLQELTTGVAYSLDLSSICADPDNNPVTFSQVSGALPDGLSFSVDTVSGTPTAVGTSDVTFRADDGTDTTDAILTFEVLNPDTVAPSAVVLTPTVYSASQINLAWTESADSAGVNERESGLYGYQIYRDGVLVQTVTAPTLSWTDTGLSYLVSYDYYVRPVDVAGNVGDPSNVETVTTDNTAPTVPTNFRATETTASTVTLQWDASTDTGGSGVAGYEVYHSSNGIDFTLFDTTSSTSSTDTGLASDTTFYFRVRAYDAAGNTSSWATANATTSAAGADNPGNPIFFDDFNYVVNAGDSGATKRAAFQAAGWGGMKDETTEPTRASGYLYTVTSIPGYSGQMPGLSGSGRVLALEGLPTTMRETSLSGGNQTDFYLMFGSTTGPQTGGGYVEGRNVPPNVWFQFWIYINNYGSQQSHWANRNKLIYPSDDGTASGGGTENAYLISLRPSSQQGVTQPYGPRAYVVNKIEAGAGGTVASNAPEGPTYVGANLQPSAGFTEANQWTLYKVHVDHASVNGTYEVWRRPMGGEWQKTTEWIGGVTPGFTWITQSGLRQGHNMIKIPTTWGTTQQDFTNYDCWVYMADFAMASSEADLPTYGGY